MATKESVSGLIDKVYELADKEGLEADIVPVQLTGGNIKGKGKKEVMVLSFQCVLDPESFEGGLQFVFDRQTRMFGVGMLVPKKYLKHKEGEGAAEQCETTPSAVGDQTILRLL